MDFSPTSEGYKIVYTNSSNELRLTDIDGSVDTLITTEADELSWRNGDKIAYEFSEGGYTYLGRIKADGTSVESLGENSIYSPQISNLNFEVIYGLALSDYRKINLGRNPLEETILVTSLNFVRPKLSFDDTKIVGGDLQQSDINGVYVTDISTGVTTQLR
ncbi:hypothetical protein A2230_03230 [candidate division WOR-1 bacterium RIFOXYA2_FULL_36_21]|nr:MAG: hypothetical protein A2230_03230 [candidate division WOR-1 bacterium RIFOXYA2_FULL_36_21]